MSVTITIANNMDYCKRHGLAKNISEPCECGEKEREYCAFCGGTGIFKITEYPYELNLANGNFRTLWAALGLDITEDWCGYVDPNILLRILATTDPSLVLRADQDGPASLGQILGVPDADLPEDAQHILFSNVYRAGIHEDQAKRYFAKLSEIALEACRRHERVEFF